MHAAERQRRLLHDIDHWRSAASETLANLLKEQEARFATAVRLRNELESLRSDRVSSPIQPSLDNESVAVAHDRLQPKTSGDQP